MTELISESNILICGSPRVGKSTLINAICQERIAGTSHGLSSMTKTINQYSFESSLGDITHRTTFWDTPGIESWLGNYARHSTISLIEQIQPICMIYCASPGSFTGLNDLSWMISECHQRKIFCALVCTQMWSGSQRKSVIEEFCNVLNTAHPNVQCKKEDEIIYYDNIALVTMVNSIEYIDDGFGVRKPVSGVEELIYGIAKCLERKQMFSWLRTVSKNKSFWTNMSAKLGDLFRMTCNNFNTFYQRTENLLDYLFSLSVYRLSSINSIKQKASIDHNQALSITTDQKEDEIYYETKTNDTYVDLQMKKLLFILYSEETLKQLIKILEKLDAKDFRTIPSKMETDQKIELVVEFENTEHLTAVYDLYCLMNHNQLSCQIVDPSTNIEQ